MILGNQYYIYFSSSNLKRLGLGYNLTFSSHYFLYLCVTDQCPTLLSDSRFHSRFERGPFRAAVVSWGVWRARGSSPIGARRKSGGHAGSGPIEGGSSGRFGRRECQSA